MGLAWIRLDTSLFDHPKIVHLFDENKHRAVLVHLAGMAYCGKHATDGFIPRHMLRRLEGRPGDAKALIAAELWQEMAGGWQIHGWADYQVSDAETQKRRENAAKAAAIRWSKKEGKQLNGF